MALPVPQPAVVILDVMNLRGAEGKRKDAPFDIGHFDEFMRAVGSFLPGAVTIGIVDGTANVDGRRINYASWDDRRELLRRTQLDPADPLHLYLLPPPERRWLRRTDLKYLPADPVCVHLLSKFSQNAALITFDLFDKDDDIAYFPLNHALREKVFVPIWLSSENSWVYLARSETSRFMRWDRDFFEAVKDGEVRRLEDSLTQADVSLEAFAEVRNYAYGLIHDLVNEHRAAGNRTVPQVLEWQRSRSAFDVLDPSKFAPALTEEVVGDVEASEDPPVFSDLNVIVRTVTEEVDITRSIDELRAHVGRRVRVTALLRILGNVPYLFWVGRLSRVRVEIERGHPDLFDGLATVEGLVEAKGDDLVLSVASGNDITYQPISRVVVSRAKRLIRPVSYVVGDGSLDFPELPQNPKRRVPPPPARGNHRPAVGQSIFGSGNLADRFESDEEVSVGSYQPVGSRSPVPSEPTVGSTPSAVHPQFGEPLAFDLNENPSEDSTAVQSTSDTKRRFTRMLVAAVAVAATLIAAGLILRQVFVGFSVPTPKVCENLESAACDAVIRELRGDALRINIYGTRDTSGVIK